MPELLGVLTRAAPIPASTWNAESWTFDLTLSAGSARTLSDERGRFSEVLDLSGATWTEPIPLLDSHRQGSLDDNLGDVFNIRREGDHIVGTVRLSRHSIKAQRIAAELTDARSFSASVGYRVGRWTESKPAGQRTMTATNWTILEASLVSVPADPSAKIRSLHMPEVIAEIVTAPIIAPVATRAETNTAIRGIAKTAGLDATWADAQIDAEVTLDAVRAAALDAMQARSAPLTTIRATVGTDHTDPTTIRSAMADALAHRLAPGALKLEGKAIEFRGHRVLDMVADMALARGEKVNIRDTDALMERAVGAHSSSDFVALLADAANKTLLAHYAVAAPTYRQWASRRTFNDWKDHNFLRVGDFPAFQEVPEGSGIQYGTLSENRERVRAKEFNTGIAIGRRAIQSDDLGGLSDFSNMIAIRAAADENKLVYALLSSTAVLSDGLPLFHATHGNLASAAGAISVASVASAVAALRKQKSKDGLVLNLAPRFLIVGPDKELEARQFLTVVNATKAADTNPYAGSMELVVDANILGNAWYIAVDPAAAPTAVYGYVSGAEGPQIRTEVDFDTRAVKVAAGLDFGCGLIDFRGLYAVPSA